MENNLDSNPLGNFSIQDTMDMGMGNTELLQGLFEPESATSNPDDVTDIDKDVTPPPSKKVVAPKAAKTTSDDDEDESSKEKESTTKSIQDFLLGDEEDEDAPADKPAKATKAPADDTEDTDDEEGSEAPESTFGSLSKDLFKLGVFTDGDDEEEPISTPEQFLERFNAEKKKGAIEVVDNFLGQFGDDYKNAFDAIFVKGVDPKDYFGTFNQIQDFADMDLSLENNQISVIRQALTDQGFEAEDIDSEIERFKNYGDLENIATKHHKVLIKKEASKLQQMEQNKAIQLQQQQQQKQLYYQSVNNVLQDKLKNKEFDGIPINPKLAGELQDFLLVDKYKTASGETLTDFDKTILELKRPENHEMKVKVGLLLKILEKDPTLSTIQKTGITKKSNELFGEVARQTAKSAVKSKSSGKSTSWFQ